MSFDRISWSSDEKRVPITSKVRFTTAGLPWAGFSLEEALTDRGVVKNSYIEKPSAFVCTEGGGISEWTHEGVTNRRKVGQGTVCLISPSYEFERSFTSSEWAYCGVQLDPDKFRRHAPAHAQALERLDREFGYDQDATLATLLIQLCAEAKAGCPTGELYAESLSLALLSYIVRRYASSSLPPSRAGLRPIHKRLIIEYIESNLDQPLSLAELADQIGCSSAHFSHSFRNEFGLSPYQYILAKRIARAKELLLGTDAPIGSIAMDLGFSSHSHFTKSFRAQTGQKPSEFRFSR
jgi:AraC family transcriptional regulator